MVENLLDARFRVFREDNRVTFLGCISDTPNLAILDGILTDHCICDFSKLQFASWIGLFQIGYYIKHKKLQLCFENVNFQIFDSMRMIKAFEEQQINSAEIPVYDLKNDKLNLEIVNLEKLRDAAMEGDEWQLSADARPFVIATRFLFSDISIHRTTVEFPLRLQSSNLALCSFWIKYGYYALSTIKMSQALANSAKMNILEFSQEIKAKLIAGETSLKILDPKNNYTLVDRINEMLKTISDSFAKLDSAVKEQVDETMYKLTQLVIAANHQEAEQKFLETLFEFSKCVGNFVQIAAKSEDCGSSIGAKLSSLRAAQVIKMSLSSVMEVTSDQLTAIREAFAIMDILSEDDWNATRDIIMEEVEQIESFIGRCIVALQGFDMMRQILEHRIHEMDIVTEFVEGCGAEGLLDDFIKSQILERISKHMVTEQEKVAFEFYFPDEFAANADTDRAEPGDVLLF